MIFLVDLPQPFDWDATIERFAVREDITVHVQDHTLIRTFWTGNKPIVYRASAVKSRCMDSVLKIETNRNLSYQEQTELKAHLALTLSFTDDVEAMYETLQHTPAAILFERFRGLRPVHDPTLFESLIRTIIGQQLNTKFAATLVNRLVRLAGDHVENPFVEEIFTFPVAESLLRFSVDDLRQIQLNNRKAETILSIAQSVVEEQLPLEKWRGISREEWFERLLPVKGVGFWTVECLLLFGVGMLDEWPSADVGLQKGLANLLILPDRPNPDETKRLGEMFAPFRSYVTYYVWHSLRHPLPGHTSNR
ncbi:DNA-3-methyladenine glycosylase family protein [Alicyclobacillus tolerans]|uniref:DNA-3-methyladenine glycosylase II n=1 Tax=Alicyclobacillus tolerans TaxID=90970 RepID=A0A1M6S7F3_9BACL|nr:DNA-3-methyladenine glycosylase [Alicyclobacillus montanus]SHK40610.1 DNA-3-methyladenine glycosylase II [Alicyclobacillus montanus]